MRRHCNAISKKAFYDQLFIDTIVIAQRSGLSKNISLMRFLFLFFNAQFNSFKYFGHSDWEVRFKIRKGYPPVLPRESFAKINYVAWCKMT